HAEDVDVAPSARSVVRSRRHPHHPIEDWRSYRLNAWPSPSALEHSREIRRMERVCPILKRPPATPELQAAPLRFASASKAMTSGGSGGPGGDSIGGDRSTSSMARWTISEISGEPARLCRRRNTAHRGQTPAGQRYAQVM